MWNIICFLRCINVRNIYNKATWFFLILVLLLVYSVTLSTNKARHVVELLDVPHKYDGTWRNLSSLEISKLSTLGKILFVEQQRPEQKNVQFFILFWKYGRYIERRHLNHYSKQTYNPFDGCAVSNCKYSFDETDLGKASIVVYHLQRTKGLSDLPVKRGNPEQIWAFLTDESPHNTFLTSKLKLKQFNGKFNWSMTYRMDSDIPVPYGRTRKYLDKVYAATELPKKRRDKLVTILGSNCGGSNHRWQYVKDLNHSLTVDVCGRCGNKTACPGHFKNDCPAINNYLFYLSFENSDCKEYVTEKVFWNAYQKHSIPIIMGYNRKLYEKLLPPHSFIHVDDFASPNDLARYLLFLNKTEGYHSYHEWRTTYEVLNEHGYFQTKSYHFCRICEALNYNNKTPKVYENLEDFWSVKRDCSVR